MRQRIYWQEACGLRERSAGNLPSAADVIVIGGGVMGVSSTYWLARKGLRVLLMEARQLGWGASGRNAGIMLPGRRPLESPELFDEVLKQERIEAELQQTGHLALASNPEIWDRVRQEAGSSTAGERGIRALLHSECEELLGMKISKDFLGGRWFSKGRLFHPLRFLHGLTMAAQRHGAQVRSRTRVTQIRRSGAAWQLETPRGLVKARTLVLACQASVSDFVPELRGGVSLCRGQVLCTTSVDPVFHCGMAVDWGSLYWRQLASGEIVLGGMRGLDPDRETGRSHRTNSRIQTALTSFLPRAFPGFPAFQVRHRWSGIMDNTTDGRPMIGPLPGRPGQWLVAGFGGHGFPPALGAGKLLADAIATAEMPDMLLPFAPDRFWCGDRYVHHDAGS